jgi:hypothetical protein
MRGVTESRAKIASRTIADCLGGFDPIQNFADCVAHLPSLSVAFVLFDQLAVRAVQLYLNFSET